MKNQVDFQLKRTNSDDPGFRELIGQLDLFLFKQFGKALDYYRPHNRIEDNKTVVLAYLGTEAVGCGCLKKFSDDTIEIKRMFVVPAFRRTGIAGAILMELEQWAKELGYQQVILETGSTLDGAIALYRKHHYLDTEKYGPYVGQEASVCLKKKLESR